MKSKMKLYKIPKKTGNHHQDQQDLLVFTVTEMMPHAKSFFPDPSVFSHYLHFYHLCQARGNFLNYKKNWSPYRTHTRTSELDVGFQSFLEFYITSFLVSSF